MPPLTPHKKDPNRKAELKRRKEDPGAFGPGMLQIPRAPDERPKDWTPTGLVPTKAGAKKETVVVEKTVDPVDENTETVFHRTFGADRLIASATPEEREAALVNTLLAMDPKQKGAFDKDGVPSFSVVASMSGFVDVTEDEVRGVWEQVNA